MLRATLYGTGTGILLIGLLYVSGPLEWNNPILEFLIWISTPFCYFVSWITGWSFSQEEGLLVLSIATPISILFYCVLIAMMVVFISRRFKVKQANPKSGKITGVL